MATDVDVQYFSHLNGLILGNNWGDLINLLDTCLVNGIAFSSITSATIDANGDINLTLFSAHNAMLFQIVELSGFSPAGLNGKYRIKGVPSATQLILKANLVGSSITTVGAGKLASLDYEIVYTAQYKRVYRAKNPTTQHPYIRVDETIGDGTNSYTSTYAKYAMVGLIENMSHIDDYLDPNKLQLPLDTTDFAKNWKITGTGTTVVRGWSRWYWSRYHASPTNPGNASSAADSTSPAAGSHDFTLVGDSDAFYFVTHPYVSKPTWKVLMGVGLFDSSLKTDIIPNWFLMSRFTLDNASALRTQYDSAVIGITPLMNNATQASFYTPDFNEATRISRSIQTNGLIPDFKSGLSGLYRALIPSALEIPIYDTDRKLRGTLKHAMYCGVFANWNSTTPLLSDTSMYVFDRAFTGDTSSDPAYGGLYFYLGELE